jgi:hypothetical protein
MIRNMQLWKILKMILYLYIFILVYKCTYIYTYNNRVANDSQYAVMKDTEDDIPGKFLEDLERKLRIDIIRLDNDDIEFDLVGIYRNIYLYQYVCMYIRVYKCVFMFLRLLILFD